MKEALVELDKDHTLSLYAEDDALQLVPAALARELQPDTATLLWQALAALEYHTAQTRPIEQTDTAIRVLREWLKEAP